MSVFNFLLFGFRYFSVSSKPTSIGICFDFRNIAISVRFSVYRPMTRTYIGFSALRIFLRVLSQVLLLRLPILLPQTFSTTCTGYLLTFESSLSLLNLHSPSVLHPPLLISHHSSDATLRLVIFVLAILIFLLFLNTGYK